MCVCVQQRASDKKLKRLGDMYDSTASNIRLEKYFIYILLNMNK